MWTPRWMTQNWGWCSHPGAWYGNARSKKCELHLIRPCAATSHVSSHLVLPCVQSGLVLNSLVQSTTVHYSPQQSSTVQSRRVQYSLAMCQTARKQGLTGMLYSGGRPAKGILGNFFLLRSPFKTRKSKGSLLMHSSVTFFFGRSTWPIDAVQVSMLLAFSLHIEYGDKFYIPSSQTFWPRMSMWGDSKK